VFFGGESVIIGGVRITTALDASNHHSLFILTERHGETELSDTHFPPWTVPEWFAVIGWVAPRGIDDLVEFVENAVLFVWVERGEIVPCRR